MASTKVREFEACEFTSSFEDDGLLGAGSYGYVRLCKHKKLGLVAVKCFKIDGANEDCAVTRKNVQKEAQIVFGKSHDFVLKVHGMTIWSSNFGIVLEFTKCKDLCSLIITHKDEPVGWGVRLRLLFEIINALVYFHHNLENPLVHGDLKLQNILLSRDLHVKVSDFGSARLAASTRSQSSEHKLQATMGYIAPELLMDCSLCPSPSQDMFSVAMIVYEVITRELAMESVHHLTVIRHGITRGHRPKNIVRVKDDLKDQHLNEDHDLVCQLESIVHSCWDEDPQKRYTAMDVKEKLSCLMKTRNEEKKVDREAFEIADKKRKWYEEKLANVGEVSLSEYNYPFTKIPDNARHSHSIREGKPQADADHSRRNINVPVITSEAPRNPVRVSLGYAKRKEDSLILVGGHATMHDVWRFKLGENMKRFSKLPSLNTGRCHHCSSLVQDKLFVIGGMGEVEALNSVEYMDMKEQAEWIYASEMQSARYQASSEIIAGTIYVLGGKNERDELLDTLECLDTYIQRGSWTILSGKLYPKRFNFSTFSLQGVIFCCGGMKISDEASVVQIDSAEMFNSRNNWSKEEIRMKEARSGTCAVKVDENLALLLGGLGKDGKRAVSTVTCYDGKSWKESKQMKMNRCGFAAGMINSTVYAVGGHGLNNKSSSLTTIERLDMSKSQPEWEILVPNMEKMWAGHTVVVW